MGTGNQGASKLRILVGGQSLLEGLVEVEEGAVGDGAGHYVDGNALEHGEEALLLDHVLETAHHTSVSGHCIVLVLPRVMALETGLQHIEGI